MSKNENPEKVLKTPVFSHCHHNHHKYFYLSKTL
uniref:Uncharacterized protein n=1 Tax=viral metagenome TaxID=1070528 RepID=A0A6C0I9M8_9ZZZZ